MFLSTFNLDSNLAGSGDSHILVLGPVGQLPPVVVKICSGQIFPVLGTIFQILSGVLPDVLINV